MPVQFYLGCDINGEAHAIEHCREADSVRQFCQELWDAFHLTERWFCLVANPRQAGARPKLTPDVVLLTDLGVGVLELKDHFNRIDCSQPDGFWMAGGVRIAKQPQPGAQAAKTGFVNPHMQVQYYARKIRSELLTPQAEPWLPGEPTRWQAAKLNTAVGFTHPGAILTDCKKDARVRYQRGHALEEWETFDVLQPAEFIGWAASLRFELDEGPQVQYRPLQLSGEVLQRLAGQFFHARRWSDMEALVQKGPTPYAHLVLSENGEFPQLLRLDRDEVVLGRSLDCSITIPERYSLASRRHARILRKEGRVYIEDIGSRYGTFVDGEPVSLPVLLHSQRQVITLGGPQPGAGICQLQFYDQATKFFPNLERITTGK